MPRKKTYRASVAVVVSGTDRYPGDVFDANPSEVDFLVGIGAIKESSADPKADEKKKDN